MIKLFLPFSLSILFVLAGITVARYSYVDYPTHSPAPRVLETFDLIARTDTNSAVKERRAVVGSIKNVFDNGVRVPILTYHYIGENPNSNDKARNALSVTPSQFEQELAWLSQNGYETIFLEDLYRHLTFGQPLPPKPIILSFDDGYVDFYYNAYPILRKYNFKTVAFIPTGLIGKPAYMNWSMIEELRKLGGVEFESHGVNHKNLTGLADDELQKELKESKEVLESKTGQLVSFLAYPYGSFNERVIQAVKQAGYKAALSTIWGMEQNNKVLFALRRIRIPGMPTLAVFVSRLRQPS